MRRRPVRRRDFLVGLGAGLAFPKLALGTTRTPDVVIVGAGAAGIFAARALARRGIGFVLLEAKNRIGGRAFTESESFGTPFDHGCSFLHQADRNPWRPLAVEAGYSLLRHGAGETVFVGDRRATDAELEGYGAAWQRTNQALRRAGAARLDIPAAEAIETRTGWSQVCENWIGPMSFAADFEDFSTADWWAGEATEPNDMIAEGFGALVAEVGASLPVDLETPVSAIDWSGPGVKVGTPRGILEARAAIVTVSTGVLQADAIRFAPSLPPATRDAIGHLPMGLLGKIALGFAPGTRFDIPANDWVTYLTRSREAVFFLAWPFEADVMVGFCGGRFGWDLTRAGEAAAVDFGLGELTKLIGADARKRFVRGRFTQWGRDPHMRGAYAHEAPGHHGARTALMTPVGDRIWFAGEAVAGGYAMTCGGAAMSGRTVADRVAATLGL
ncbi:MAG: flavin monoamine oxidase family protein [Dongiaceae bacterium]